MLNLEDTLQNYLNNLTKDKIRFSPIRGIDADIRKMSIKDGNIYFAYDTGYIYLDKNNNRYVLGGNGSSDAGLIWADAEEDAEEFTTLFKVNNDDDEDKRYLMSVYAIEGSTEDNPKYPQTGLLVINSDGRFFRVTGDDANNNLVTLDLIAVSGTGSGGGASTADLALSIGTELVDGATFIYGQNKELNLIGYSTKDNKISITIDIYDGEHDKSTEIKETSWNSGRPYIFNAANLPESKNITLTISVTSANTSMKPAQRPKKIIPNIRVVKVGLEKFDENLFIPLVRPDDPIGELQLSYIPYGDKAIEETLHVYVDDQEITKVGEFGYPKVINNTLFGLKNLVNIPRQSHGVHKISLRVSVELNGETIFSDPIEFEGAWATEGEERPIIWIGNYDSTIINYENSYIRYMVYDPVQERYDLPATVYFYKNNVKVLEIQTRYSADGWLSWDITNIYDLGNQIFSISCRTTVVNISISVTAEGSRDLSLVMSEALAINMTTAGRSNNEVKSSRNIWQSTIKDSNNNYKTATLTGFNWQNNGWRRDDVSSEEVDNGTYLSLTGGAKVSIPVDSIYLNYDKDFSIEARFRIRNVQKYSTLIQSIPLYFYENDVFTLADNYQENTEYYIKRIVNGQETDIYDKIEVSTFEPDTSYYTRTVIGPSEIGARMSWILENNKVLVYDDYGSPKMDEKNIQKIHKYFDENDPNSNDEGIVCQWMNSAHEGLIIGSQEAYFKSPRGMVNVRYKEDEVINLTVVISKTDGLVYIYLNGILSGADSLPNQGAGFTINSPFVFNSTYCDVDLYRFRIYNIGLTMPDVIHNYLSDLHNIALYDQNQLTEPRTPTALSYELLTQYNNSHQGQLTMPYAVWKIKSSARNEKLPYYKGDKCKVDITFVNPSLDEALENSVITPWEYYTSSPSFYAEDVDIDVQGTSSQAYPRRNYKTKYKESTIWKFTKGPLAEYPLSQKVISIIDDKPIEEFKTYEYFFYKNSGQLVVDGEGNPVLDGFDANIMNKLTKNFHMDNAYIGTNKFTWKIDYMESSGSYNTGFANLMGNLEYPLYRKHPLEDLNINSTGMRTTVYGYPVLTFHEYENANFNPTTPGQRYEYIGRYNMNLDKSSNEYYGFESTAEQPYMEKSDGTHPKIKEIAECWELEDNQGTWTSFKYPNSEARALKFATPWPDNANRYEAFRHFEYRYSAYDKELDAIGAEGMYDGKMKDDIAKQITNDNSATASTVTDSQKSAYMRQRYSNLEILFNWLDSTNPETATNDAIHDPQTDDIIDQVIYSTGKDYTDTITGTTSFQNSSGGFTTTFTKDTKEFRLEKFRNEFDKHLDKEYCLVYFVLTELLLCYDSRGKNMMLASFGPHELGGDYIWYPIFYDIDTQLGLNNSGAYLWDYDADVSIDGLFSTPSSVLWNNLFTVFEDDIKNEYRILRGASDGTKVVGNLGESKIAGAYECNPEIFNSWAMKGIRPIIAIGLDEYYKYFATTKTGYFDTSGTLIIESSPSMAYACQGDKKLTTELLIRNRLNYIDSWWLGGNYNLAQFTSGQFWGRMNGNRITETSDVYLDISADAYNDIITNNPNYQNILQIGTYPVPYYDSQPGFKLKPFLKQYVSYYTDQVPGSPVKYNASIEQADGVWTKTNNDVIETYKSTKEAPNEQLVYVPGVDYLSSLGDLSVGYFSEFTLTAGKRLLDLNLGSDAPGYKNDLLTSGTNLQGQVKFDLSDGINSSTKKSLLKKINLTGLSSLNTTIDIQGSEKLEEFRALNTQIINVYFANGAPLHTVHLPNTLTSLQLIENTNLTRILNSKPTVATLENEILKYSSPESYAGLYIEDVTDYKPTKAGNGHALSTLIIEGGGLGYSSYKLLENLIELKTNANANKKLVVSLKDVKWSPYIQVQEGEEFNPEIQYYILTDHSTFEEYNNLNNNQTLDSDDWASKLLNGKIYVYNENYVKPINNNDPNDDICEEKIIKDLSMLDKFIEMYETSSTETQFQNITTPRSVPAITGEFYVSNDIDHQIIEEELTSKYEKYWPNLKIYAAYITESYISKFIQIDDNGKEIELSVKKLNPNEVEQIEIDSTLIPSKVHYDFIGWSLDKEGTKIVSNFTYINYDDQAQGGNFVNNFELYNEELTFNENNSTIILYAIFEPHKYKTVFNFDNGTEPEIIETQWSINPGLKSPSKIPVKDYDTPDFELNANDQLGLYRKYKFKYWKDESNQQPIDLSRAFPNKNRTVIAIYEDVSVYDDILDLKYLNFNEQRRELSLNTDYYLSGKITLPTQINNIPVEKISGFMGSDSNGSKHAITHIFWALGTPALTTIVGSCFRQSTSLVYYEQPSTCRSIGAQAFSGCTRLGIEDNSIITNIFRHITHITGANILESLGYSQTQKQHLIMPGGVTFDQIAEYAFGGLGNITHLQIGSVEDPCKWFNMAGTVLTTEAGFWSMGRDIAEGLESLKIYISSVDNTSENRVKLLAHLGVRNIDGTTITDEMMERNDINANYTWIEVS